MEDCHDAWTYLVNEKKRLYRDQLKVLRELSWEANGAAM